MHRLIWLPLLILIALMSTARADFVTNHYPGGHGPLSAAGSISTWGEIELCCRVDTGGGERWLGSIGSYSAYPSPMQANTGWIRRSSSPNTYAVAYEFLSYPYGRTSVVSSSWVQLAWNPAWVSVHYDIPCPNTPGMNTVHVCSGNWTPLDDGAIPTYIIGNGIVKTGLPYGDYLKDTSGGGPPQASWCSFYFSNFPGVTKPSGVGDLGVAVDTCS